MFPALDADLHFGYQLTGSLVVARGADEASHLQVRFRVVGISGIS